MFFENRFVKFSFHAVNRLKESQLTIKEGLELFANAKEEKLDKGLKKLKKYDQTGVRYFRNGTILFTAKELGGLLLIMTVTDQMITGNARSFD